jgi:hypothetical protein
MRAFEYLAHARKPFRAATASPPNRESALVLARYGEEVLAAAERLTRAMEYASGRPIGRAINLAGRQRMLSPRMSLIWSSR